MRTASRSLQWRASSRTRRSAPYLPAGRAQRMAAGWHAVPPAAAPRPHRRAAAQQVALGEQRRQVACERRRGRAPPAQEHVREAGCSASCAMAPAVRRYGASGVQRTEPREQLPGLRERRRRRLVQPPQLRRALNAPGGELERQRREIRLQNLGVPVRRALPPARAPSRAGSTHRGRARPARPAAGRPMPATRHRLEPRHPRARREPWHAA